MKRLYGDASSHLIIEVSPAITGVEVDEFFKHKRDFPSQGFFLITKDEKVPSTSFYADHQEGIHRVLFVAWVGEYPSGDGAEQILEVVFRLCPKYDEDADPVIWETKIPHIPELLSESSLKPFGSYYAAVDLGRDDIIRTPFPPKVTSCCTMCIPPHVIPSSLVGIDSLKSASYVKDAIRKSREDILNKLRESEDLWDVSVERSHGPNPYEIVVRVTFDVSKMHLFRT